MNFNGQDLYTVETQDSAFLSEWRNYQYSLTDKLQAKKGSTHLEVLSQQWIGTTWWDTNLLQISEQSVFQREIMMSSQGVDYWYARTIVPQYCYRLYPDFFKRLENESIKNLIFGESNVHCMNRISYPVNHYCLEFHWVKKHLEGLCGTLWVRVAEYSINYSGSFFLVEILLPELGAVK